MHTLRALQWEGDVHCDGLALNLVPRRAIACGNSIAVFYYVLIIIATNTNTDLAILSRHTTYSTWVDVMSLMCKVELWYMRTCTVHVHQLKDTRRLQVHGI